MTKTRKIYQIKTLKINNKIINGVESVVYYHDNALSINLLNGENSNYKIDWQEVSENKLTSKTKCGKIIEEILE